MVSGYLYGICRKTLYIQINPNMHWVEGGGARKGGLKSGTSIEGRDYLKKAECVMWEKWY